MSAGSKMRGWLAAIALVGTALVSADATAQQRRFFDPLQTYRVAIDGAPMRGPEDAPVTIVEFSDFQCRFCVRAQATITELERLFSGRIRMVYRNNPLDPEDGTLAAEASLAAGAQGRYWAMHDRLFSNPFRLSRAVVDSYALEIGLDMVRFRSALDTRRYLEAVLKDSRTSRELGLSSTPMFFVNGRPIKGAQPLSVFVSVVGEELRRARGLMGSGVASSDVYKRIMAGARLRGDVSGSAPSYPVAEITAGDRYWLRPALPGHSRGPAKALVTIIELSDFECGFCAREAPVLRELEKRFPGEVRVEFRHLPLAFHRNAELAAEAAVAAAAQGKFWPLHDAMFSHALDRRGELTRPVIERYARTIGLDMKAFRAALDDRRYRDQVAARSSAAKAIGVTGTPTLFVNGSAVVGALPLEPLVELVEQKLAEAKALVAAGVSLDTLRHVVLKDADVVELGVTKR